MATDVEKYKSQNLQIAGFAFFTPISKIFLNIPEMKLNDINLKFIIFFILSLLLVFAGIIFISRGMEFLKEK